MNTAAAVTANRKCRVVLVAQSAPLPTSSSGTICWEIAAKAIGQTNYFLKNGYGVDLVGR